MRAGRRSGYTVGMTRFLCLLFVAAAAGCDNSLAVHLPQPAETATASHDRFDPTHTGTIRGRVTWAGDQPTVPPVTISRFDSRGLQVETLPNPNAPDVAADGAVRSAVVFLRGVDASRAKPMPTAATTVELDAMRLSVVQNGTRFRTAFVPVGAEVAVSSKLDAITGVRGRGADFFTRMLPPAADIRRTFVRPGRVELTTASGQYWAAADLFVCEHAYFARPDAAGRFTLADVPNGEYELVCWHPNWHIAATERDPETAMIARQKYAPPVEKLVRVSVPGTADVTLSAADFN